MAENRDKMLVGAPPELLDSPKFISYLVVAEPRKWFNQLSCKKLKVSSTYRSKSYLTCVCVSHLCNESEGVQKGSGTNHVDLAKGSMIDLLDMFGRPISCNSPSKLVTWHRLRRI
jgi:hypothetical protein